jgi:galactose-6-phosphate isomerase
MPRVHPELDVTEVLDSIEFADSFDVVRRTQTVDSHGIASDSVARICDVTGVVIPNKSANLMVTPEGEHLFGSILIYSLYRLSPGRQGAIDADLVVWNGREYIVSSVDRFTSYGRGFTVALCTLHIINPAPN